MQRCAESRGLSVLSSNNISARERNHTLVLEAGLYLLRYASTHAPEDPPFIQVQPSDADVGVISLMSGPGASHQRLREPGGVELGAIGGIDDGVVPGLCPMARPRLGVRRW